MLVLLATKGESAGEFAAIAKYVRAQSIKVEVEVSERKALWLLYCLLAFRVCRGRVLIVCVVVVVLMF